MSCDLSLFGLNACKPTLPNVSNPSPTWNLSSFRNTLPEVEQPKKKTKPAKKQQPIEEEIDFSEFKKFLDSYTPNSKPKLPVFNLPVLNLNWPSYNYCNSPSWNYACKPRVRSSPSSF